MKKADFKDRVLLLISKMINEECDTHADLLVMINTRIENDSELCKQLSLVHDTRDKLLEKLHKYIKEMDE